MTAAQLIESHKELEERVLRQQQQHATALAEADTRGAIALSPAKIAEQAGIGGSAPRTGAAAGEEGDESGVRTAIGGYWRDSVMEPRSAAMVLNARYGFCCAY